MSVFHSTSAYGINNSGQVVGAYGDIGGNGSHGFLYSGGSYTTIDDPLGIKVISGPHNIPTTEAFGINNLGQIVGLYEDNSGIHGFLDNMGIYTTLDGPPGSVTSYATGINDLGQIVGQYTDQYGFEGSYIYSNDIYTLLASVNVTGINDSGQIVGSYSNRTDSFLASPTPLPSTWIMMLPVLAGVGFVAYRRQKQNFAIAAA